MSVTLIKKLFAFSLIMKTVTFIKPEERFDEITAYQIGKADKYTWGIVRVNSLKNRNCIKKKAAPKDEEPPPLLPIKVITV